MLSYTIISPLRVCVSNDRSVNPQQPVVLDLIRILLTFASAQGLTPLDILGDLAYDVVAYGIKQEWLTHFYSLFFTFLLT